LELAEHLKGKEGGTYREGARRIIEACVGKWGDFDAETDGILGGGSGSWHGEKHHEKIIYGDYYLLEALLRLEGKSYLLW
jgi:unsaturated chondroitin disaccharide hydrolase